MNKILKYTYCVTIFLTNYSNAQQLVYVENDSILNIGTKTLFYEDVSNKLTINDFLNSNLSLKKGKTHSLNFGPSASTFWFIFNAKQNTSKEIGLKTGRNFSDKICLYSIENDEVKHKREYGIGMKQKDRDVDVHDYIFKLHPSDYYVVELKNLSGPVIFKPSVGTLESQITQSYKVATNWGVYFGLLIILAIYSIIIFIYSKNVASLFYLGFIVFTSLQISMLMGTTALLYPESLLLAVSKNHIFPFPFVITFAFLFLERLLRFKKYFKSFYIIGLSWPIIAFVSVILFSLGYKLLAFNLTFLVTFPYIFLLIFALTYLSIKQGLTTRLISFGNLLLGIGGMLFMLSELGWVNSNALTENGFILGSSLEMIFFAIAMATESNKNRKEKENSQKYALFQSKQFSADLIEAQENERKRIAAELHDGIGQSLIIIKNKFLLFQQQRLKEGITGIAENVSTTIEDVRKISYALRPHKLDVFGLSASIEDLITETQLATGIEFIIDIDSIDKLFNQYQEINLYRVIQELINNIVKHSECSEAKIILRKHTVLNEIIINITDNGKGILNQLNQSDNKKSGFGLKGIDERLNTLNGKWQINKNKTDGTSILIIVPFPKQSIQTI